MAITYRTPLLPFPPVRQQRFWENVKKIPGTNCWEWQGVRTDRNYGTVYIRGKVIKAHRLAFALTFDTEPTNDVLHTCDNPPCCNPAHLYEGTSKDNARDKQQRGRSPACIGRTGETSWHAKLTWKDVDYIRAVYIPHKFGCYQLARKFGLHPSTVRSVIREESWRPESRPQ